MPNNTDNSGSARAARVRRAAQCCERMACSFQWADAAMMLTYSKEETIGNSTYKYFTGVIGHVGPYVTVEPSFGEITNFNPSRPNLTQMSIETYYKNNSGMLSVTYKVLVAHNGGFQEVIYVPNSFTQGISLTLSCDDIRTVDRHFTCTISN